MSWLFSQVLVEEYLGENFSDGEQSVPSNGNHIQQAYLQPDRMTKFSRVSRFGMTFKLLTESRGEELLTLYLAGRRERIWIVGKMGNSNNDGQTTAKIGNSIVEGSYGSQTRTQQASESQGSGEQYGEMDNSDSTQLKRNKCSERINKEYAKFGSASWWQTEPNVGRVADGVDARVDRLKAIGNGQVPLCAATAWRILSA